MKSLHPEARSFPKENGVKKTNWEGHEFHSCRFNLAHERGFQPLRCALKPGRLISPPGTYFVTFSTWQRRRLFIVEPYVRLFLKTLYGYRRAGKLEVHEFVVMPDPVHLLLTPASDVTLERAIQLIKGGYSHALGSEIGRRREVWQRGFTDHRIRDERDFMQHVQYIHQNPIKRGLVAGASGYGYGSAFPGYKLDGWPAAAKAAFFESA